MAKQLGLHKVQGRVGEYSYYDSKNGGSLVRSINQGMSERVKSSKEYANTRLNNAEFGGAGSCAGAIVRGITSRWRFILSPKATGLLAKDIKAGMMMDTTSAWGKRVLTLAGISNVQSRFNMLSKNQMPEFIQSFMTDLIVYDSNSGKIHTDNPCQTSGEFEQELLAKGATGVVAKVFAYAVDAPTPDANENKYEPSASSLEEIPGLEKDITLVPAGGQSIIGDVTATVNVAPENTLTKIGGVLVVLLPYKTIGGKKYTLQELCSAFWKTATPGTVE